MIHPLLPVVYKDSFDGEIISWYGALLEARTSSTSTSFITKAPYTLLYFCMLGVSEAYNSEDTTNGGSLVRAGALLEHATALLDTLQTDMASRLVRCQAALLLAYASLGRGQVNVAWM
jgi:hypothetical protein